MTFSPVLPTLLVVVLFVLLAGVILTGKGKWRGVIAAVLGVLMGMAVSNLRLPTKPAVVAVKKAEAPAPAKPPEIKPVAEVKPAGKPPALKRAKPEPASASRQTAAGRLAESLFGKRPEPVAKLKQFENLNFTLLMSGGPWVEMNAKTLGSDACYMARQNRRNLVTSIVIEPLGLPLTSEGLTEIIRTNLEASGRVQEWKILDPTELAGLPAPCAGYIVSLNGRRISYVDIHQFDHGWARQFVVGSMRNRPLAELRKEAIELAKGFRLIDPQRVGGSQQPQLDPAKFPAWGCEVRAGGQGWTHPSEGEHVMGEIWNGNFRGTGHLAVVPVNLGSLDPDAPALARGLVSGSTGRAFPTSGFTEKKVEIPGAEAVEYEYHETLKDIGEYYRIVRIIRRGQAAWLVDAGTRGGLPERLEALRRAVELVRIDKKPPAALPANDAEFHGQFFNQAGLSLHSRANYPEARRLFEEAFRQSPDKALYLHNILECLANEGNPGEVVKRVEALPAAQRKTDELQQRLASACAALGRFGEAREAYKALFAGSFRNDDILEEAINFLLENSGKADALALMETYQKGGTNQKLDRLHASVLVRNGRHQDAAVIMEKLHADAPGNNGLLIELADVYAALKRHDEAITLLREALAKEPKSARLLFSLGYQLADSGKFEEAAEILEEAVVVAPKDETIQDELAYVRSRLGRGHDREIRTALDPVPLPASLEVPADWNPSAIAADADRYHLVQATAYQFAPGSPISRTLHSDVLVLTERSVASLSTLRFKFTPLSERIFVNRLEVTDKEGKVIATGKAKDQYITDDDGGETANASKVLCVPVPGLAIGCRVQYAVTFQDRSPSKEFPFATNVFATRYGARVNAVCVRGAIDSCAAMTRGAIETKDEDGFRIWSASNLAGLPDENRMADLERFAPCVYLGPTGTDWTKLGDKYLDDIATQLKADPDIESLARDLVADAPDDAAKIRILYRWIENEFTYKAIEFGTRARIPHPAGVTCANRYGDCKDLSVLLHSMLRAVGIDSSPCLVNTSDLLAPAIPTLDQFNHMIVYLPAAGGRPACWLDPTDRHHALVTAVSPWLENKSTYVLGKGSSRFEIVPALPFPSPHRLEISRRLEPGKGADLLVSETLTFRGHAADGMRSYMTSIPAAERIQRLREWIAGIDPALTLNTLEAKDLTDQDQPFALELTLTAADHLDAGGKLKQVPVSWEREYLRPVPQRQRGTPFSTDSAWQVDSRTCGSVPLPDSAKPLKSGNPQWGDWEIQPADGNSPWNIAFSGSLRKGDLFEAKDYAGYFDFWDNGLGHLARPWQVK